MTVALSASTSKRSSPSTTCSPMFFSHWPNLISSVCMPRSGTLISSLTFISICMSSGRRAAALLRIALDRFDHCTCVGTRPVNLAQAEGQQLFCIVLGDDPASQHRQLGEAGFAQALD